MTIAVFIKISKNMFISQLLFKIYSIERRRGREIIQWVKPTKTKIMMKNSLKSLSPSCDKLSKNFKIYKKTLTISLNKQRRQMFKCYNDKSCRKERSAFLQAQHFVCSVNTHCSADYVARFWKHINYNFCLN